MDRGLVSRPPRRMRHLAARGPGGPAADRHGDALRRADVRLLGGHERYRGRHQRAELQGHGPHGVAAGRGLSRADPREAA